MRVIRIDPNGTALQFVFEDKDGRVEDIITVVVSKRMENGEFDVIEDGISSYIDDVGVFSPVGLITGVLDSFGYEYELFRANHTFRV